MNREEAKFILGVYRPNSQDADDPQFQEALALLKNDPELARWFAAEQALDAAISHKIRSLPAPSGLRAQLLAARKTVRHPAWWRQPAWLAAAASIALLLAAGGILQRRESDQKSLASFRHAMVEANLDLQHHLDVAGLDPDALKQWLADHHADFAFVLPKGLADQKIGGCKIIDWRGHKITLLCFMFDGKHEDFFVVDAASLPASILDATPRFAQDGPVSTAAWKRDGKIYLLAGNIPEADLKALF